MRESGQGGNFQLCRTEKGSKEQGNNHSKMAQIKSESGARYQWASMKGGDFRKLRDVMVTGKLGWCQWASMQGGDPQKLRDVMVTGKLGRNL